LEKFSTSAHARTKRGNDMSCLPIFSYSVNIFYLSNCLLIRGATGAV
jgi:hypothetical protein